MEFALCLDKMDRSEPLIPVGGISRESRGPDRFSTVLLPSVVASLAALNFGFTLGYTSPTETELTKDLLTIEQFPLFTVSQEIEDQFLKLCEPLVADANTWQHAWQLSK